MTKGLLWFGGPSNHYALPRHAQGPIPQVSGGRLIIEGVNWISARCVYTDRTGGREHLPDEPSRRIIACRGSDGELLWDEPHRYTGPLIIHGDKIISSGRNDGAVDLLTGQVRNRVHPITGLELPWTHTRTYGCGTVLGCEHLLTFRSGAAGFFDIGNDAGTGNWVASRLVAPRISFRLMACSAPPTTHELALALIRTKPRWRWSTSRTSKPGHTAPCPPPNRESRCSGSESISAPLVTGWPRTARCGSSIPASLAHHPTSLSN